MKNPDLIQCDVCIIGGNIAGAYLAYILAEENVNVIVVEEHKESGEPLQCAGIFSEKLTKIIDLEKSLILNRVKIARLVAPGGSTLDVVGRENPFIVDRVKLDRSYYQKAINKGAVFLFNEKFLTYRKIKNEGVRITTDKRTIFSDVIIGCDGPRSRVAKLNGVQHNFIQGMQVRAKYNHPINVTSMFFSPKWKELFGWIIPEGKNICRIGMGCRKNPKNNFKSFLIKVGVKKSEIIDKQGGLIPYGYIRRIAFDRALLLGDAACMVKATTGGGVIMLLSAAEIAKSAILMALKKNNFSEKFLIKHYERNTEMKKLRIQLKIHFLIRIGIKRFTSTDFENIFSLYQSSKTGIKELVLKYADMDFPKTLIIKCLFNVRLFLFLLNFMIRNRNIIPEFVHLIVDK
ncbi:MAG: geranylgeranyl reductase family protein [Promethearchaeota archaeon]